MENVRLIKVVVWDLDNTIWDGTLIEGDAVTLKPQIVNIIRMLDERGILQSIASRNNFEQALVKLREFAISDYFIYPQIGWGRKSESVERIRSLLNVKRDAILVVDDDPFELAEIGSCYPEVVCWDAKDYGKLLGNELLMPKFITEDTPNRRLMYLQDVDRTKAEEVFSGSKAEFLSSLGMRLRIHEAGRSDLERIQELMQRTNQLNTTGIIYTVEQLKSYLGNPNYRVFICDLTDKFGSYGKVGVALVEVGENSHTIRLFLMSCRVLSRGVSTVFLQYLMNQSVLNNRTLLADFVSTPYNRIMMITYRLAGFEIIETHSDGHTRLRWGLNRLQPYPQYLTLI